jgi:hypothetical protein
VIDYSPAKINNITNRNAMQTKSIEESIDLIRSQANVLLEIAEGTANPAPVTPKQIMEMINQELKSIQYQKFSMNAYFYSLHKYIREQRGEDMLREMMNNDENE